MKKSLPLPLIYPLLFAFIFLPLSASTVDITLPKVPEVPEVPKVEAIVPTLQTHAQDGYQTNEQIIEEATRKKEVHFSDHVAPEFVETKDASDKIVEVGDIQNGKVTAYLHASLMTQKEVTDKLTQAGFKVLKSYKQDKKGDLISIVFTNDALINASSKSNRGFMSTLRVTIDKKNSLTSITNPPYVMRAFMQNEYDETLAMATLTSLRNTFKELTNSTEELKFRILERYQFMEGMPKYTDMQVIAKASNATLLAKAKKSKKVLYEITLENGSTVLGVELSSRTSKFVKKTGYQNAGLLPYPVLIENDEAKILDPKYYIAIMYPMLKMSQFMTIATVPGAINKDIDKIFR
jgi:hypothetical protein